MTKGALFIAFTFLSFLIGLSVFTSGRDKNVQIVRREAPLKLASILPVLEVKNSIENPEFSADSVLVKRLKTGEALLSRNEKKPRQIASLTKLMTLLVFLEEGGRKEDWIGFSFEAKNTEEKKSKLGAGEKILAEDTIKLLLIESDNDAALALAEFMGGKRGGADFGGSIGKFGELMNEKARALGVASTTTNFSNPHGLDDERNFSSAYDLSLIIDYIQKRHSYIWGVTRTSETAIFSESGVKYPVINTNELLKKFPAIIGGKTGYTDKAKGALVLLYAIRPDELISIVILGSDDRFSDGQKIIEWLEKKYVQ